MAVVLLVMAPGIDRITVQSQIEAGGHRVEWAPSGLDAVENARRSSPDLVAIDSFLPSVERWHAVKHLGFDVRTRGIRVVVLPPDAARPTGWEGLRQHIASALASANAPRTALGESFELLPDKTPPVAVARAALPVEIKKLRQASGYRVLVVDDEELNRDMLSRRLDRLGHEVDQAASGAAALELLAAKRYDAVVLDWMMPVMSGLEVLARVRERWSSVELPVIMATARTEPEDLVEALRQGANDYVTKPINHQVLAARLQTQLALRVAHRAVAESEMRFRALLENTGDVVLQHRPDGRIEYVSPAVTTLLGHDPFEFAKRSLWQWLHPRDREALKERPEATLPAAYTYLARLAKHDGSYLWVEVSNRRVTANGEPLVVAACRDVSEYMDRLVGDQPALPLGGDIMDHPEWRATPAPAKPR